MGSVNVWPATKKSNVNVKSARSGRDANVSLKSSNRISVENLI